MADDLRWPRASAWLAGEHEGTPTRSFAVLGAPLRLGSITRGRCDLAPSAIRAALYRYSTYDFDAAVDVRCLRAVDLGDLPLADTPLEDALEPLSKAVQQALASND